MIFRKYDSAIDQAATQCVWREVGWLQEQTEPSVLDKFLSAGRTLVAEIRGDQVHPLLYHCLRLR